MPLAAISRDGTRAVFRADAQIDGCFEVFAAPLDGGAPAVRLNAPFGPPLLASAKSDLAIAPDSATVLFRADSGFQEIDLFAAPLDGYRTVDNLLAALAFLQQPLPPAGNRATVAAVLDWAVAHWRVDSIPRGLSRSGAELPERCRAFAS